MPKIQRYRWQIADALGVSEVRHVDLCDACAAAYREPPNPADLRPIGPAQPDEDGLAGCHECGEDSSC